VLFRKVSLLIAVLLLAVALPVSAHDLPMGGSRWRFGSNSILGYIDLKASLFCEIKEIKEGHYDLDAASAEQLQQIAHDVLQPYVSKTLSITVNEQGYPIQVNRIVRNDNNLYTLWLSVEKVRFDRPLNDVKIVYSLLREETNNEHVNLAYGYLSDATGAALQNVFDFSPPAFQTTFNAASPVWEVTIKGAETVPDEEQKIKNPVTQGRAEASTKPAAQKTSGIRPASAVPVSEDPLQKPISAHNISTRKASSSFESTENRSASANTASRSLWATVRQFVLLGIEHILTGYDHIAFLLALIVIELSIREILKIITAFTVAHSITLLLAATEVVRLNSALVESVIACSICYVALENIFKKKVHYRWLITFGFGLIHGFGFASALSELIVGKSNLLLSVVCFNLGVELGQLMLFFILLPVLYLLKKHVGLRTVTVTTSAGVFAIGFAWVLERVFHLKLLWF
jgi:hydrogenase/urease accessory protein HupE